MGELLNCEKATKLENYLVGTGLHMGKRDPTPQLPKIISKQQGGWLQPQSWPPVTGLCAGERGTDIHRLCAGQLLKVIC